jgi:hypothetical protein
VVDETAAIASIMKESGLDLVVVLASDATGTVHDQIRRVKDGWKKLNATIDGLMEVKRAYPNLILGLKTTILPLNIDQLEGIA